jgi:CspA family cold shock protein
MPQGTIKKLVADKGFGFIEGDGGKRDMFFHVSSLVDVEFDNLQIGQMVEYEIGTGPKGPRAENVRVVG